HGHSSAVTHVMATSDWRYAVSASLDKILKVWDLNTGSELSSLLAHSSTTNATISPDRLSDSKRETKPHAWISSSESRVAMAITPEPRRIVAACHGTTLRVWDLQEGTELHELSTHSGLVNSVAITEKREAISSSSDATLKVWEIDSGREIRTL